MSVLSIAPMIDWSYSHFRVFMRMLADNALVYSEMQTTGAIQYNGERALSMSSFETPVALQLGGAEPSELADCAAIAEEKGYSEVNLNLGCPSDRVQAGRFGACLMSEPSLVADCIIAMKETCTLPVTAKTRIGIDHLDSYPFFKEFIDTLIEAGVDKVIVHARKAWLKGLSPKENRTIPNINYDYVYRIKKDYPSVPFVINGNINLIESIQTHLQYVDGVMIGRLAYQNPYEIAKIHHALFPAIQLKRRSKIIEQYFDYVKQQFDNKQRLSLLLKPIFNMAYGLPHANQWKKKLMAIIKENHLKQMDNAAHFFSELELKEQGQIAPD